MNTYRIGQTKYARDRNGSGIDGRWNFKGEYVIYTAGTLALACLEKLAHTSGTSIYSGDFSVTAFEIPPGVKIAEISIAEILKQNSSWQHVINYPITQQMGSDWLRKQGTAVLKVPSAIIDLEHNYLFNPSHPDFAKMKITNVRKFNFDDRLKAK
jgi:RES domain-containing protein